MRPILAVLLLLAACDTRIRETRTTTDTAPAEAAVVSQPCRFLSEAEASALIGQTVVYRQARTPNTCNLGPAGDAAPGDSRLSLVFGVVDNVAPIDDLIAREDAAIVAGVGERAVWLSKNSQLVAKKGSRRLVVTVTDSKSPSTVTESELQQKAVAVAEKIANRL